MGPPTPNSTIIAQYTLVELLRLPSSPESQESAPQLLEALRAGDLRPVALPVSEE
jgi:hypothetical protein